MITVANMPDNHTAEQRRRNMARIRGRDTRPEKIVRSLLHRLGYRFRLYKKDLPGTPDLVFSPRRKVIFVHGCFWHLHECRKGKSSPSTNAAFWKEKRERNASRDGNALKALHALGWETHIVWECALKNLPALQSQLEAFLSDHNRLVEEDSSSAESVSCSCREIAIEAITDHEIAPTIMIEDAASFL